MNLGEALKYCHDLRATGYSGWRLATIDELEAIRRSNLERPDPASTQDDRRFVYRLPVELLLTGDQWSSSPLNNDRGLPAQFVWYLNVNTGTRVFDDPSFSHAKRALCVRNSVVQHVFNNRCLGCKR